MQQAGILGLLLTRVWEITLSSATFNCYYLAHIYAAFRDWRVGTSAAILISLTPKQVYAAGVIYFGVNCSLASLSAFLPTILKTLGFGMFLTYGALMV